jgi:LPXTG-motif cell wall-anchored protein
METFGQLLATGDTGSLVLAVVAFALAALLAVAAVRLRPRSKR